jgi:hypothetical protein
MQCHDSAGSVILLVFLENTEQPSWGLSDTADEALVQPSTSFDQMQCKTEMVHATASFPCCQSLSIIEYNHLPHMYSSARLSFMSYAFIFMCIANGVGVASLASDTESGSVSTQETRRITVAEAQRSSVSEWRICTIIPVKLNAKWASYSPIDVTSEKTPPAVWIDT